GLGPSPRSVFPFCLSHQAVGLASLARQPIGIRLGIVPIHAHYRIRPALGEPGDAPRTTPAILKLTVFERLALGAGIVPAFRHEGCELIDRDMKSADRKLLSECDIMLRAFLLVAILFTLRRPHRKGTRRHDHHLRAPSATLEYVPRSQRAFLTRRERRGHSRSHRPRNPSAPTWAGRDRQCRWRRHSSELGPRGRRFE